MSLSQVSVSTGKSMLRLLVVHLVIILSLFDGVHVDSCFANCFDMFLVFIFHKFNSMQCTVIYSCLSCRFVIFLLIVFVFSPVKA